MTPEHAQILEPLLTPPGKDDEGQTFRPPWSWQHLDAGERAALSDAIEEWRTAFNATLACEAAEIIPPCWRRHPGLAIELAVQVWLHHAAHRHPKASPAAAAEYYGRHLPGFRKRITGYLGDTATDCRAGRHRENWRASLDKILVPLAEHEPDHDADATALDALGALGFGVGTSKR